MKIEIIPKASIAQVSQNINCRELACQCDNDSCAYTLYSPDLIDRFEELRYNCGNIPINILSAFRCWKHNQFVGGVDRSKHLVGMALDLSIPNGFSLNEFAKRAWGIFDVVIPYKHGKFTHVHINYGGTE